tara:strand:- start:10 stop:114 length:105 start_codon:yes stop_codon:yes gene_type:complete
MPSFGLLDLVSTKHYRPEEKNEHGGQKDKAYNSA